MRLGIKAIFRDIAASKTTVLEVIEEPSDRIHGAMRVGAILTAQTRWGKSRAERFLQKACDTHQLYRNAPSMMQTRLRDLTDRERDALVAEIHKTSADNRRNGNKQGDKDG